MGKKEERGCWTFNLDICVLDRVFLISFLDITSLLDIFLANGERVCQDLKVCFLFNGASSFSIGLHL